MRPRTVVYIVVLLLLGVFVLANWETISRPTELNLLVAQVIAPLGVLLLLVVGGIVAIDIIAHAMARHAWTRERRDLTHAIEQLRARAEQAEESRIVALRELVERETSAIRGQLDRVLASLATSSVPPVSERRETVYAGGEQRWTTADERE